MAVEEAIFLTKFASKVYLIHRRDELRAEKILQKRLFENEKIQIIWNKKVTDVLGKDNPLGVTGIQIKDTLSKELSEIDCSGVFEINLRLLIVAMFLLFRELQKLLFLEFLLLEI